MFSISLLHYSRREATGPSSLALDFDAMAQPRWDYSMVQVSIDIFASAAPPDDPWTVEHLLQHFHLEGCQCEVNDLIYPMMSGPGRYLMPSVESLEQHWVSWDESLVSDRRVHWAICERELFRHMADASQVVGNICTLGDVDPQDPHLHVRMELHFLAPVAILEVLNRVHRTVRRHAVQIQQLTAQINQIQLQLDGTRGHAGGDN